MSYVVFTEQASAPATPAASKVLMYQDNSPRPRMVRIDDTGVPIVMLDSANHALNAFSASTVSGGYASDTYLAGSGIAIPTAGGWKAGTRYRLAFDMTKTAAGVATPILTVRLGTAGTTADPAILALTFGAGTAAVDTGLFELLLTFRTVGAGTSAVVQGVARCGHHLAATGLTSTGASGTGIITGTSAGFASTTQTVIGCSFNGGASFSGTCTLVQAALDMIGY